MNRVEELIQQLCPNGVEWKKLGEVTRIERGKRLTKSELLDKGDFPVFHGGIEPLGYYNSYNRECDTVMIINVGASAGTIGYSEKNFWSSDGCFCIKRIEQIKSKFLYYFLIGQESFLASKVRKAGIPTLDSLVVENILVPIPPLPIQQEIVRILDTFTELQKELTANLQTELDARKKQYAYYRDCLLNFEGVDGVEWKKLGKVCNVYTGGEPPKDVVRGDSKDIEHPYPVWANGKDVYGYSSTFQINKDATVISSLGANTGTIYFREAFFTPVIRLKVIIPVVKDILSKYLYYYLSTISFVVKSSSVPNMNANEVKNIIIPIPPLPEQRRIVAILDKFETLVNDLSVGLPAELEARRKQYEYYRDKLLTFDRV